MSNEVNLSATTNRTLKFVLTYYTDETETTPFPLTGYSVRMGIADQTGAAAPGVNNSTNTYAVITNAAGGVITVTVPNTTTAGWAVGTYNYDLVLTSGGGEKEAIMEGSITVKAGIAA
jgi:hypothetical protein